MLFNPCAVFILTSAPPLGFRTWGLTNSMKHKHFIFLISRGLPCNGYIGNYMENEHLPGRYQKATGMNLETGGMQLVPIEKQEQSSLPMQYCPPFLLPRSYVFMSSVPVHNKELSPHSYLMVHCSSQITELSGWKIGQTTLDFWNGPCFLFLYWWQREVPVASTLRITSASNHFYFISILLKKRE